MTQQSHPDDAILVADLNDLLQLDHDAVDGYTLAIDTVRDDRYRDALVNHRADHKRHIEELSALVRAHGGLPVELPHPTAPFKLVVEALGAVPNDQTLLLALKAVEGQVRDKYVRFAGNAYPQDVRGVILRATDDELRHYQWAEEALRELGVGAGTVPHAVASAVEQMQKLLADPLEAAERKVMQQVGTAAERARRRRDRAAPSPPAGAEAVPDRLVDRAVTIDAGRERPGANASRFIAALRAIEREGDLEPMLALYDRRAETTGPADQAPHVGVDGARHFWHMYRESFEHVESIFTNIVDDGHGTAMLEWTSHGYLRTGSEVRYAGATVLEMRDGRIRRFRAYFNPRDVDAGMAPRPLRQTEAARQLHRESDMGGTVL